MVRARLRRSKGELFSYVDLKARVRVIIRWTGTIMNEALSALKRAFAEIPDHFGTHRSA